MIKRNTLIVCWGIVLVAAMTYFTTNGFTFEPKYIGGEIMDGKQYARALEAEYDADPSDIAEVEEIWGEPIPDHLLQVGWLELFSWASIYHLDTDPPHVFRGEFRDRNSLYKGTFEYYQRDNQPLPEHPLRDFYMNHIASGEVNFDAISPVDGFYVFILKPTGEVLRYGTPEAELYRKQRDDPKLR